MNNNINIENLKNKVIAHAKEWAELDYLFFKIDNEELINFNSINHLDYIDEHLTQSDILQNINDDTLYTDLLKLFNKVFKDSYLNYIQQYEEEKGVLCYE